MKIKADIDERKLLFIDVPGDLYRNFKIVNYGYAGTYIMETDSTGLNHWKMKIPNGNYEILGFSDDVLENMGKFHQHPKNFVLLKV